MAEISKLAIIKERFVRSEGPCGFCGISLEKGAQIYAIYDALTGMLLFFVAFVILLLGDLRSDNGKHYYPAEKVSMPRELVIFFVTIGFYCGSCSLLLFYAAGSRNIYGCFIWLGLNFPLNLVSPAKIYGTIIVYKLAMEITQEKNEKVFSFDEVQVDLGLKPAASQVAKRNVPKI